MNEAERMMLEYKKQKFYGSIRKIAAVITWLLLLALCIKDLLGI